jgi:hypothetical protein
MIQNLFWHGASLGFIESLCKLFFIVEKVNVPLQREAIFSNSFYNLSI